MSTVPMPETMPSFTHHELDDVQSPMSDFSLSSQVHLLSGTPGIFSSLSHTEPSDLAGPSWDATAQDPQNFTYSDQGDAYYAGDSEDFLLHFGQVTPTHGGSNGVDVMQTQWAASSAIDTKVKAEESLGRRASQTSTGGQRKQKRSSTTSSRRTRARVQPVPTRTSSQLSRLGMTGNASAAFPLAAMDRGAFMDQFLAQDLDSLSVSGHMAGPPFMSAALGMVQEGLPMFPNDAGVMMDMDNHVNPQAFDAGLMVPSPDSWASLSPTASQTSSPEEVDAMADEIFSTVPSNTTPAESLASSSPVLLGVSPKTMRKLEPHVGTSKDFQQGLPLDQDSLLMDTSQLLRRDAGEGESARDHPLYKNAFPQADGLYHCPWEGEASCNHKPEKLKCNYDKFVDSHLKPYRCKFEECRNTRFSSTACQLRHEREAHAMHGHGQKPYTCLYEGCDRALEGFPRLWNLRDHMRRVHNDSMVDCKKAGGSKATSTGRGRKRKADDAEKPRGKSSKAATLDAGSAPRTEPYLDSPMDQWLVHLRAVRLLVQGLEDATDPNSEQRIQDVQERLAFMSDISRSMKTPTEPRAPLGKQSG